MGGVSLARQREWRHLDHMFPRDAERLAAGRQETNCATFLQDDVGQDGDGIKEMLAVVDDE